MDRNHPFERLHRTYRSVRAATEALCEPLSVEDYVVQSMPDASPVKWHLAHTSWFFETFVLCAADPQRPPIDPRYAVLFNSYYHAIGSQHPRHRRGLLSRPTVDEVRAYRRRVDDDMEALLAAPSDAARRLALVIEVGLNHEEQHQELLITDVKHLLCTNPVHPVYRARAPAQRDGHSHGGHLQSVIAQSVRPLGWRSFSGGVHEVGHRDASFAFDNEQPRHSVMLNPFSLADRLVTCGEYLAFIEAGGYQRPDLWLSDGWDLINSQAGSQRIVAPLYWESNEESKHGSAPSKFQIMTLAGLRDLDPAEPVSHVSYYEADAYARFAGARLPREEEWEVAAQGIPVVGNFLESGALHPLPVAQLSKLSGDQEKTRENGVGSNQPNAISQLFGDLWEWTASPYAPYPGFQPFSGLLGEYNGKFMCNQMVLRGGSCATPTRHLRATYRNFFPPQTRWQLSGIRLAKDGGADK